MNYDTVISNIEKPDFKQKQVKKYQNTDDIITDLIYCFKKYNYQAKPIADKYKTGNIKQDARTIYDFIKKNIKYDAEPEIDQTTRSFSRIIHDKWGDCKHTALIVASIGYNEGYNVIFRVVRYVSNGDYLYHVYALLENKFGRRVIVDPLQDFDFEKKYDKKIGDYKAINNMALTRLTGTSNTPRYTQRLRCGQPIPRALHGTDLSAISDDYDAHQVGIIDGIGAREIILTPTGLDDSAIGEIEELQGVGRKTKAQRQQKKQERKQKREVKKEKRQEKRADRKEKIKSKLNKGGKVVKKVALAPVRGAFSALLLINYKSLATRLQKAIDTGNSAKVDAFAKKFGYNNNVLRSQIKKGSTKKSIGTVNPNEIHDIDGMGVVVTAAAIATASTAIAAALALLKSLGLGANGDEQELKNAADNIEKGGGTEVNITQSGGEAPMQSGNGEAYAQNADTNSSSYSPAPLDEEGKAAQEQEQSERGFLSNIPKPVLYIGGAAILYFAGKKMKLF